jgi:heme/copper-type cytochrome/quinol oxidase subunit 2
MFVVALFTFDSYGVSWDEPTQRETGQVSYDYVFSDNDGLLTWKDRDYGVAFELPLIIIEEVFNLEDTRSIYMMRHLVTHFFFLVACYFLFILIDFLYKNKLLATVGFLLLALYPRIYAHSFFNTKDLPFLSMLVICLYYFVKAFDKKSILNFIKLGICVGLLINLRIMGVLILSGTLSVLLLDLLLKKEKIIQLKSILVFLIFSCVTLYITWPFLWKDPLNNFILAFENMSSFRWGRLVLYKGEMIKATELGWDYIPTWFTITTPLVYILLGVFGFLLLVLQFFKRPSDFLHNSIKRTNMLFLGYFIAPILAVIILHSVVYDGWRQMFFIYPSFVLLIIYGLSHLLKRRKLFITAISALVITFLFTAGSMIRNFPVNNVYFSELLTFTPPEYLRKNYEMDYWGVSYKQSLEHILKVDSDSSINISVENPPGITNTLILPYDERKRFNHVGTNEAKYFITNYRWHPQEYSEYADFKFHSLIVDENTVNEIFKLK